MIDVRRSEGIPGDDGRLCPLLTVSQVIQTRSRRRLITAVQVLLAKSTQPTDSSNLRQAQLRNKIARSRRKLRQSSMRNISDRRGELQTRFEGDRGSQAVQAWKLLLRRVSGIDPNG